MDNYNLQIVLNEGKAVLRANAEPEIGAKFLLMDLFELSEVDILLGKSINHEQYTRYMSGIHQLAKHVPLSHITGFQMFCGEKFKVTRDTLVPRPETEHLIEVIQREMDTIQCFADIGTGTGIIAITLQKLYQTKGYAVDISDDALHVAVENANIHQVAIRFMHGDLLAPLIASQIKVDCLVSNPPYISTSELHLMNETALHDPKTALFAEDEGLALYFRMIEDMHQVLMPNALVVFEIGHLQAKRITEKIHKKYPNTTVHVEKDINNLDRVLWFRWCE